MEGSLTLVWREWKVSLDCSDVEVLTHPTDPLTHDSYAKEGELWVFYPPCHAPSKAW